MLTEERVGGVAKEPGPEGPARSGALRGASQALATEEARLRELFAALRVPIVTTNAEGRIVGFNAAAVSLFGSPARLYARPITELLPFAAPPADGNAGDLIWQGRLADATGRTVDLDVSLTLLDQGGEPVCAVYVVHDISRHAEVNRLREQLLYSVAHELRGPLMVLDNALEILAADYGGLSAAEFAGLVGSARRTARRLRALMEDLLSAGSIQSGRFVVAPRPIELGLLVTEALETVAPSTEARRQRVELDLPREPAVVLADQRYACQLLSNLLANASKYGPEGSVLRVWAEPTATMMRVAVEDQGPGIPPERRAGLFERFYRVRASSDVPGVGLGLAIAKGIVEAHGGSIGIDGAPGTGTRVWFTLPASTRRHADPARR